MLFKIQNLEYKSDNQSILKNKNFFLEKNKHLLIHGPSGSGKTTLINLMSGLLKPTYGKIIFENKDYSTLNEEQIDKLRFDNFGFIFQKLHLIGQLNVDQNIILGIKKKKSQNVDKLIENLGLLKLKKQLARNLSFGEAQRVAIARGVANNPRVIFADEPTSSLDYKNAKNVMNLIFSQVKQTEATLIVCTHDDRIKEYFSNLMEI